MPCTHAEEVVETGIIVPQGYYRRADANMVLGKHKEAVKDFQRAERGAKSDPDLKRKLAACQKEVQRQRFARAVSRAHPSATI
jgi:serine/threonine-protein phosphatase 5